MKKQSERVVGGLRFGAHKRAKAARQGNSCGIMEMLEERRLLSVVAGDAATLQIGLGLIVQGPIVSASANQAPEISWVTATPGEVVLGHDLTLTAGGVSDADGSVEKVEFYLDSNGDGELQPLSDQLLATDSDGRDGWTATASTCGMSLGTQRFFARAQDDLCEYGPTVAVTAVITNQPPAIGMLGVSFDPSPSARTVTLTARRAADNDGQVAKVEFYLDANDDGILQPDQDTLLGADQNGADGWSWTGGAFDAGSGAKRYFAVAQDDSGAWSQSRTATAVIFGNSAWSDGVLTVWGTSRRDTMAVGMRRGWLNILRNGTLERFRASVVQSIVIGLGDANDKLLVGSGVGPIWADGGAGNDVLEGTDGNDSLFGGDGNDVLVGRAGDDWLSAGAGDDLLDGQGGNDFLCGGDGNDLAYGGEGLDRIHGDAGNDTLWGGEGDDTVWAGAGNDLVYGCNGRDVLSGEADSDTIWGGLGNDTIDGGAGQDLVHGEEGNDLLRGGDGDDQLWGDDGIDRFYGGDGDDIIYAFDRRGELLNGGNGFDCVQMDITDGLVDVEYMLR